jgi:hypothetical protein
MLPIAGVEGIGRCTERFSMTSSTIAQSGALICDHLK